MVAQNAGFTISGCSFQSLDEQYGADIIRKIPVPATAKDGALEFLRHAGVRHFSMFPDLIALARDIRQDVAEEMEYARTAAKKLART
jgi:hypothetical protein